MAWGTSTIRSFYTPRIIQHKTEQSFLTNCKYYIIFFTDKCIKQVTGSIQKLSCSCIFDTDIFLTSYGELPAIFQTSLSGQLVCSSAPNKLSSVFNGRDKDQGAHSYISIWTGLKRCRQGNCFLFNQTAKIPSILLQLLLDKLFSCGRSQSFS